MAGSRVFGVQYCLIAKEYVPAMVLRVIAFAAWLICLYGFMLIRITQTSKPDLETGLKIVGGGRAAFFRPDIHCETNIDLTCY